MTITNTETFLPPIFLKSTQITTLLIVTLFLFFQLKDWYCIKLWNWIINFVKWTHVWTEWNARRYCTVRLFPRKYINTFYFHLKNMGERSCVRDLCVKNNTFKNDIKTKNTVVFYLAFAYPARNDKLWRIVRNRSDVTFQLYVWMATWFKYAHKCYLYLKIIYLRTNSQFNHLRSYKSFIETKPIRAV